MVSSHSTHHSALPHLPWPKPLTKSCFIRQENLAATWFLSQVLVVHYQLPQSWALPSRIVDPYEQSLLIVWDLTWEAQEPKDGLFFLRVENMDGIQKQVRKEAIKDLAVIHFYGAIHVMKSWEEENISLVIETSCVKRGTDRGQERFSCWIKKEDLKKKPTSREMKLK